MSSILKSLFRHSGKGSPLLGVVFLSLYSVNSRADFEIMGQVNSLQLPAARYHYQAWGVQVSYGSLDLKWVFNAALAQPFELLGYRQWIGALSLTREFGVNVSSWLRPFVGAGPGIYLDRVNNQSGWVPSLVTRGGVRLGGSALGVEAHFDCHAGIYSVSQLGSWVIWPLTQVGGGVYAEF